jgi:mono/diheme cytochrome c family protein
VDRIASYRSADRVPNEEPKEGTDRSWNGRFACGLALLLAVTFSASPALATHEPPTEKEAAFQLVLERCYLCHYLDRTDYKFAPSLKGIYTREGRSLANGKPVNDQTLTEIISEGTANMPGFKYTLKPQQIQLILKFLKEGWAAEVPMLRNSR